MSNNHDEEETEEWAEMSADKLDLRLDDCVVLADQFAVCKGKVYMITIGKKTVFGKVIDVKKRFLKIVMLTDNGKILIDLKKASTIQEITQE